VATGGAVVIGDIAGWLTDPAHWHGPDGVPAHLVEHLGYTLGAVALAVLVGLPLGLVIGHTGRGTVVVAGLANAVRALPTLGLLTLFVLVVLPHVASDWAYLGPGEAVLFLLAVPPVLTSAYAGVQNVPPQVRDAAEGMGMTGPGVLFRVELPCALPLILSGVRAAVLQCIATATVLALVTLGGFGRYIIDGLAQRDFPKMASGALLVASLALIADGALVLVERVAVSPGVSGRAGRTARPALAHAVARARGRSLPSDPARIPSRQESS
jgi:osmoprotectant transport system permease protein